MRLQRRILGVFLLWLSAMATTAAAEHNLDGVYIVKGQNPNGTTYEGTAAIAKLAHTYSIQWQLDGQLVGVGIGILRGDHLAVIFQTARGEIGLAIYTIKGKQLEGAWTTPGSDMVTVEILTRAPPAALRRGPRV